MFLNQRDHRFAEQLSQRFAGPLGRTATILVVGLAGLIHLSLIREHFEEQFVYGLIFTALALFQLTLALLLALRPGAAVYLAGIWGSGFIVLVYVLTRLIPLPGASGLEEVDAWGIAATGLELAAVPLLAVALPEPAAGRPRGAPVWWGITGAALFAPLWLIATGVVQWTSAVYASSLTWVGTGSWSTLTPLLVGSPLPHVWLAAPWWGLPAALLLSILVGFNLWLSTRMLLAGTLSRKGRRARLLALLSPPGQLSGRAILRRGQNSGFPLASPETTQEGGVYDYARCRGRMVRHPAGSVLRAAAAPAPPIRETQRRWTAGWALRDVGGALRASED